MLTKTLIKYSSLFLRNIDKNNIRMFLESSPLYPNLLSVLQTLQYVGLDVYAGQCDWGYLNNLKSPFLLHINIKSKETLAISRWNRCHNVLEVLHPAKNKWEINNKENITNVWDGVVIYTDATPITNVRAKKNLIAVVSILLFLFVICMVFVGQGTQAIFTAPVLLGLAMSACMYWQNYISPISIVNKICHSSSTTDCDAVAESKYSKLGGLSMSCMAVSYFMSQLSCLLMACALGLTDSTYTMSLVSAIVVVPVAMYSAYSQWKVRKICPLCLMILACVILQTAIFCYMPSLPVNFGVLTIWAFFAICFLCLLTLFSQIRLTRQNNLNTKIENLKLKRNKDIFLIESSYAEQIKATMKLGRDTANINVTTIISPSCKHCRKVVSELLSLAERDIKFQWNIVLGKTTEMDSEIIKIWIQSYLSDKDKFIHELHLWSIGKTHSLYCKFITDPNNYKVNEIIQENDREIERLNISGFPRIVFNDRLLSSVYSMEDLEFIIADQVNNK